METTVNFSVDVDRRIVKAVSFSVDVARHILKPVSFTADVQRAVNHSVTFDIDVVRKVKKLGKLRAWLPFDKSVTEDICGNTWQTVGNPSIGKKNAIVGSALQLDGQSYLKLSNIMLGGQDFEISGLVYVDSASPNYARVLNIVNPDNGYMLASVRKSPNDATKLDFWANSYSDVSRDNGYTYTSSINSVGERVHFKLIYRYSDKRLSFCINDVIAADWTAVTQYNRRAFDIYIGNNVRLNQGVIGSIDELRIYDGTWFSYNSGNTPTADDYIAQRLAVLGEADISLNIDVQRKIKNASLTWRYFNLGNADDLIISGTTLTDLPETESKTGTAFYQTTRAKCFDLPTTPEIWIKFDAYFDGSNRWRAYNGGANGITGLTAQTSTEASFFSNGTNVKQFDTGTVAKNQLQTVLLHMISDSSAGVVEAWVDGTKIYRYTGNVNNGQDFADIYLQSDGSSTFFSNVLISNARIGLNDGYKSFTADVARKIKKRIEFTADVSRILIIPIVVPFIGEHFNHLVRSAKIYANSPRTIILPKKSSVYIRATGDGAIRIFSDTDREGKKTGEFYAQLDECNTVFIVPTDSPLRVIRDFVHALSETTLSGTEALDEAINYCTRGIFDTRSAVVEKFMNDLSGFDAFGDKTFLQDYCDINVANADTGAITGIDAGGGGEKTAQSIVPEPVPVEDWVVPVSGSSKTIHGLTINFPTSGASGALTDVEKHILAGLNSVWFDQCLKLVEKSFGLSFRDEDSTVKTINVEFENDSTNSALAYTAYTVDTTSGKTVALRLVINMWHYNSIDTGSADGAATYTLYLDRTLAHELTHAVMAANIDNFNSLPAFIKEGIAELVHGIDNTRRSDITALVTSKRSDLQTIISGINTEATNSYFYSAGYLFLRYLAKQGQNDSFAPQTLEITDLLISDGATDSDYNALTDNTRQIFNLDILRTLIKQISIVFDTAILQVMYVNFIVDIARALLAELILFPLDSDDFLAGLKKSAFKSKTPTLRQSALDRTRNTQGLQSFEVTIAEQQITEQVNFVGVLPFDIMQKVTGQYLDYHFNMRVEKVQQEGIIYRCECCSDLDKLLFTQLAYTIPPSTWHKVGADDTTVEIETHYPPATAHVQKIAAALGLTPVMQFDNFLSTVLMDDLGGVTYNDLIRDVFGWSSRVPHRLINCYIRDGKLYVIQRGHEAHTVDISNAKCSMPVITKELIRTTWGSTPWSKTQTTEFKHTRLQVPDDVVVGSVNKPEMPDWGDYPEFSPLPELPELPVIPNRRNYISQSSEIDEDENTTSDFEYDEDNLLKRSETRTEGKDGVSKTITHYYYKELRSGRKILVKEITEKYSGDVWATLEFDERITVNHTPLMQGQEHVSKSNEDGEIGGTTAGQTASDYRVTPFMEQKWLEDWQAYQKNSIETRLERANTILDWCKKNRETAWNLDEDRWERFNNYHEAMQKYTKALSDQRVTDTETWELTTNGLSRQCQEDCVSSES